MDVLQPLLSWLWPDTLTFTAPSPGHSRATLSTGDLFVVARELHWGAKWKDLRVFCTWEERLGFDGASLMAGGVADGLGGV